MKLVRHKQQISYSDYDNYFYGYRYDFVKESFAYTYSFQEPPKKDELNKLGKGPVYESVLKEYDFFKEIEAMKHKFIKDGEWHPFPDLASKLNKVLNENS